VNFSSKQNQFLNFKATAYMIIRDWLHCLHFFSSATSLSKIELEDRANRMRNMKPRQPKQLHIDPFLIREFLLTEKPDRHTRGKEFPLKRN
jgi:hypothetical protein